MRRSVLSSRWAFAILCLAGAVLATGCSKPETRAGGEAPAGQPAGPARYTVRAEVVGLPDASDPDSGLTVHHEAIEGLVGIDGEVWGMDAMTMEFPLAGELSVDGIAIDDKVEFTLVVEWLADVPQRITEIRKLPADTELVFRAAKVPGE